MFCFILGQGVFQPCQPQNTNGLQNLAAVAAAVGHQQQQQQQQMAAAALLSQQKENMGFTFSNLAMMQQVQNSNSSPSLLPLIRVCTLYFYVHFLVLLL